MQLTIEQRGEVFSENHVRNINFSINGLILTFLHYVRGEALLVT